MRRVYTVGHSTRNFDELVQLLKHYQIEHLVDVRSIPRSRTNPQFNQDQLEEALPDHGIKYSQLDELGGLRSTNKESPNQGWRNKSFRGYADYMQTSAFQDGLDDLQAIVERETSAIMCAEAVPWRCHRSMIGDALLVRGYEVYDIFDQKNSRAEKLTSFAKVNGTTITYPNDPAAKD